MEHGQEAPSCLVVARRNSAEALEVVEEAFDSITQAVEPAIRRSTPLPAWMMGNDRCHAELANTVPDPIRVVARIANQSLPFGVNQHFLGNRSFVLLPGSHLEVERLTARRCDGVNFR